MLSFYLLTFNWDIKAQLCPLSHICSGLCPFDTSRLDIITTVGTTPARRTRADEAGGQEPSYVIN
ncbi:MAG: hypothetical protein KJ666_12960 [Bacteroidetes bacterium]|nr:hypothetical protein [Bacteroidota bacterium]